MTNRAAQVVSLIERPIRRGIPILTACLLSATCTTDATRGPSGVSLNAAANTVSPAVVDLWGEPFSFIANSYASAVNPAGVVVGRTVTHVVMWDHGTITPIVPLAACGLCFVDRSDIRIDINAAGQIVGVSNERAFEWDRGTFIELSAPPISYASWINDAGDVLGAMGLCTIALPECRGTAVLWRKGTPIPLTLGGKFSTPAALNAAGDAVGEASLPAPAPHTGAVHAFLWRNGTMTDLGTAGGLESSAMGINAQGQVVGFSHVELGVTHAILWDHGTTVDLGVGRACAINSRGQILGESEGRAIVWDRDQIIEIGLSGYGMGTIGDLCGAFEPFEHAPTINAAGDVALNQCTNTGVCSAYLWQRGTLTQLDDLGGGHARIFGINPRGWIVGQSTTPNGDVHAVLWTR